MDKKEINIDELLEKINNLEGQFKTATENVTKLQQENEQLKTQIANIRVDNIVKPIETKDDDPEPVTFDFDI